MIPETWPEAGEAPYNNVVGVDPQLVDPEHGDYRPQEGSGAEGYGCQTFVRGVGDWGVGEAIKSWSLRAEISMPDVQESIRVGGHIIENTVWAADTVLVDDDVIVDKGVKLTIVAGTRVVFPYFNQLQIQGCLEALGTAVEPIYFTSLHPELFSEDQSLDGAWNGIVFDHTPAVNDTSRIHYCVLEYSKAVPDTLREEVINPGVGGALRVVNFSKLEIACCVFRHNLADFGGAIYCYHGAAPVLAGNLLTENRALVQGSAVFCDYAYPRLVNNTITGNIVESGLMFLDTGAVDNFHSKPLLVNNIIQDNFTDQWEDLQVWEAKEYYAASNNIGGLVGGTGNIDLDPLFAVDGEMPGVLTGISPCVDAGDELASLGFLLGEDLLGAARVSGDGIDMGAFEWGGVTEVFGGEVDGTGVVGENLHLACWPNPFNPRTKLSWELGEPGSVTVEVLDVRGRRVVVLLRRELTAGRYSVVWDGRDQDGRSVPCGVYFGQVRTASVAETQKLLLIR